MKWFASLLLLAAAGNSLPIIDRRASIDSTPADTTALDAGHRDSVTGESFPAPVSEVVFTEDVFEDGNDSGADEGPDYSNPPGPENGSPPQTTGSAQAPFPRPSGNSTGSSSSPPLSGGNGGHPQYSSYPVTSNSPYYSYGSGGVRTWTLSTSATTTFPAPTYIDPVIISTNSPPSPKAATSHHSIPLPSTITKVSISVPPTIVSKKHASSAFTGYPLVIRQASTTAVSTSATATSAAIAYRAEKYKLSPGASPASNNAPGAHELHPRDEDFSLPPGQKPASTNLPSTHELQARFKLPPGASPVPSNPPNTHELHPRNNDFRLSPGAAPASNSLPGTHQLNRRATIEDFKLPPGQAPALSPLPGTRELNSRNQNFALLPGTSLSSDILPGTHELHPRDSELSALANLGGKEATETAEVGSVQGSVNVKREMAQEVVEEVEEGAGEEMPRAAATTASLGYLS